MVYVPTIMVYFVGVAVFVLGTAHQALADNKVFALSASIVLLTILVVLNVIGLGVGKWINNVGAIGTIFAAAGLIWVGGFILARFGPTVTTTGFLLPVNPRFLPEY